jgi:hypothetical protein
VLLLLLAGTAAPAAAQTSGALAGRVRDAVSGRGVADAVVLIEDGRRGATTDTAGVYRIREVRSGWYRVTVRAIGYRPVGRDSVLVRSGETTRLDIALTQAAVQLDSLVAEAPFDPVLDPFVTQTEQTITALEIRQLPVSSVEEAVALSAGAVGESYRGGRLGQESFIIDGLGVKNQLDASTGSLGIRIPPDALTEVSLVTNGFSARYGQALSGLVNVVTRDGGDRWSGRVAYESDRLFSGGADLGLDRAVVQADGPVLGGVRALVAVDVNARLDADPVNAPRPEDARDPRFERPGLLPHNSGEQYSAIGKLTIPFGTSQTLRVFGMRSIDQRMLYDPIYKYDVSFAPARRLTGTLLSGHLQHASRPEARLPLVADLRVGWFERDFVRGALTEQPDFALGAFTGDRFRFVGEDLARAQDTVAAAAPLDGFPRPDYSWNTPWGVPAFFMMSGGRGELAWNHFRELRTQLDVNLGVGRQADLFVGGEVVRQQVETFQRVLAYLPAGDTVPPPTASTFDPLAAALYAELQFRISDLAFTGGLRYDRFDTRADLEDTPSEAQQQLNPRIGVSTVLKGATVVASVGSFSQAPDYQYLIDAAFDDTTRTGRFRQGNPNLGFERSWQYELSVRGRLQPLVSLRVGAYVKRLEGLVSSAPLGTDPDSTIFGSSGTGSVKGGEVIFEREVSGGWGAKIGYTLQQALASSTSAFLLRRLAEIDPVTGDTIYPAHVEFPLDYDRRHSLTVILRGQVADSAGPRLFGARPLAGFEAALIGRYASGLPFTRRGEAPDTLGVPNDARLPAQTTFDLLLRRPISLGWARGSVYFDARNLLNTRNTVAVRRDTGTPDAEETTIEAMAEAAYAANSEPIPYESPRYRPEADINGDGLIAGRAELFPMFLAAARDFTQPLFSYGPPRQMRLGLEFLF